MSRTKNFLYNLMTGLGSQVLILIFSFVTRTVFINTLGIQYLGLSGLFTSITSMLSLAELGFGTAIVFNMYKPIADKDEHQIFVLMKFYKTIYRIVGLIVAAIGAVLIPFLPYLINKPPTFVNIYLIYGLYLLQSVSSYLFFAYKGSLLRAHQKTYIITRIEYIFIIATYALQIGGLFLFRNFVLYIVIVIVANIFQNYVVARKTDKMYPFIKQKSNEKLTKEEVKGIFKNCYALSLYKINAIVLNATDNLVLSKFIGLAVVGLYSNYLLITLSIKKVSELFAASMSASVGNLRADSNVDTDKELLVFKAINMLSFVLHGVAAIGVFTVVNPFITWWLGKDFLLPQLFVFLLCADLYFFGIHRTTYLFRNAMGLFQQAKYRPFIGSVINLGLTIILVKPMGISGVILGTVIAGVTTYVWIDPYIVFKYGFKRPVRKYYLTNFLYLITVLVCGALVYYISGQIHLGGILYIIVIAMIAVIVPCLIFYLLFGRTKEAIYLKSMIRSILKKAQRKLRSPKL